MTVEQIQQVKNELDNIVQNHAKEWNGYLDANWVGVVYYGKDWRLVRKAGCKKTYHGWMLYSTCTNTCGSILEAKIHNAISNLEEFTVVSKQL